MVRHRFTAYLMMLLVSVIWGVAGPVIKFTLHDFPPLIFLTYRFAISSIIAFLYFGISKEEIPTTPRKFGAILLYSILAVPLGLGLIFFGFDKTTSLAGSMLSGLGPLVTVAAGAVVLKEHVTKTEKWGIAITFVGTLIVVLGPLLGNGTDPSEILGKVEGNTLLVLGHIIDVGGALIMKIILRHRVSPTVLTHVSFMIGLAVMLPIAIAVHSFNNILLTIIQAPFSAHLGVLYMAILSGTLAYTLRNRAVKTIEVSEAALFSYLYPLWAAPLSVWWLKETISPQFLFGSAIIAAGVMFAEYKRRQRKPSISRRQKKK